MLLTLSSCPSSEHTSNDLSFLTLLTFIKESCTWSSRRLRCSASVTDLTPGRSSPMPGTWCVTGSVVTRSSIDVRSNPRPCCRGRLEFSVLRRVPLCRPLIPQWSSGTLWTPQSAPVAVSESSKLTDGISRSVSLSLPIRNSWVSMRVTDARTTPLRAWGFRTPVLVDMIYQSDRSHRLATIPFEGPMFALRLILASPN